MSQRTSVNSSGEKQQPSTAVAALLSLLAPGAGLYYIGRSLKEAMTWYTVAIAVRVTAELATQGHQLRDLFWTSGLNIGIGLAAMAHTIIVARACHQPLEDARRLPALSVVLPGLGQLRGGWRLRGIMWLAGLVLFALLSRFLYPLTPTATLHVGQTGFFVAESAYSLLSGYDMHRIPRAQFRGTDRKQATTENGAHQG